MRPRLGSTLLSGALTETTGQLFKEPRVTIFILRYNFIQSNYSLAQWAYNASWNYALTNLDPTHPATSSS